MISLQASVALFDRTRDFARPDPAPGRRFVESLRATDGDVLNWDQRFVVTRAGEVSRGLEMAFQPLEDLTAPADTQLTQQLTTQIIAACRERRFAGVIDPPAWLRAAVPFGPPTEFAGLETVSGAATRYFPVGRD